MSDSVPEPTGVGPLAGGNLRASDADRDQVTAVLSTAYAEAGSPARSTTSGWTR